MSRDNPVNEGLIHAWLDGQLPPEDAAHVEHLVATDPEWGAAAAEARGLVAAASRALSALDDVPRVARESTSSASSARSTGSAAARVWWRATWMRAAAGIVLVVGVSSVVWQRRARIAELDELVSMAAPATDSQSRVDSGPIASQKAANEPRDRAVTSNQETQIANRSLRDSNTGTAREQRFAGANEERKTTDVARRDAAAAEAVIASKAPPPASPPPAPPSTPPVVDPGRVATTSTVAGGRGANTLALTAKASADSSAIDPRLAGCWMPVDAAPRQAFERTQRTESLRALQPLRFIAGVTTDLVRAPVDATPPVAQTAGGAAGSARAAALPAMADAVGARTAINATVTRAPQRDSTFVAEWIDQNVRRIATFTAQGDTLRGAMRVVPGDSTRSTPFVAARVVCVR